jgi:signal transduction histidine kinase
MKPVPRRSFSIATSAHFLALLAAGVLLLDLLVVTLVVLSLYLSRNQYATLATVATQNLAQVLEHDIAAAIDKIDLALLAERDEVARQIAGGGIDGEALRVFVAQQLARQPDMEYLRFANAQGNLEYDSDVESGPPVNVADREYFIRLRDDLGAGLVITKPLVGRITEKWGINLARRVNEPNGSFAGVVLATISLEHFQKLFSVLNLGNRGAVSLHDSELDLVVRYAAAAGASDAVGSRTVSKELQEIVRSNPSAGTFVARTRPDDIERANSYRKVSNFPFYIIVGLATDDFLATWRYEAIKTLTLAAVFVVVTLALSWLIYRSWKLREELSRRVLAVQEDERRRLAAELHDRTSPSLAAASLNLGMIAADLPPQVPDGIQSRLADTRALLADATAGVRNVCADLRPATLDYAGLPQALREYAERFSQLTGIAVKVSGENPATRMNADSESMLFRVAQEALTNCAKHAQASAIDIELHFGNPRAVLAISDNGTGFDLKALGQPGHRPGLGLLTMRERVELAGGKFSLESAPGKGTRIMVEI